MGGWDRCGRVWEGWDVVSEGLGGHWKKGAGSGLDGVWELEEGIGSGLERGWKGGDIALKGLGRDWKTGLGAVCTGFGRFGRRFGGFGSDWKVEWGAL